MDNLVLKKKLSTFKTEGGMLRRVSDELLLEILRSWEAWTGTSKDFYHSLGLSKQQLANFIRKGKKIAKNNPLANGEFQELKMTIPLNSQPASFSCSGIEILWGEGKVIRFPEVDLLIDFLKKAA